MTKIYCYYCNDEIPKEHLNDIRIIEDKIACIFCYEAYMSNMENE